MRSIYDDIYENYAEESELLYEDDYNYEEDSALESAIETYCMAVESDSAGEPQKKKLFKRIIDWFKEKIEWLRRKIKEIGGAVKGKLGGILGKLQGVFKKAKKASDDGDDQALLEYQEEAKPLLIEAQEVISIASTSAASDNSEPETTVEEAPSNADSGRPFGGKRAALGLPGPVAEPNPLKRVKRRYDAQMKASTAKAGGKGGETIYGVDKSDSKQKYQSNYTQSRMDEKNKKAKAKRAAKKNEKDFQDPNSKRRQDFNTIQMARSLNSFIDDITDPYVKSALEAMGVNVDINCTTVESFNEVYDGIECAVESFNSALSDLASASESVSKFGATEKTDECVNAAVESLSTSYEALGLVSDSGVFDRACIEQMNTFFRGAYAILNEKAMEFYDEDEEDYDEDEIATEEFTSDDFLSYIVE